MTESISRSSLTPLLLAVLTALAGAQQPAACAAPQHRQFDFWIGTWEVTGADGRRAGINRIEPILGGCALYESWEGASGSRGHSLNAWDPGDNKWHQTWMDNEGTVLIVSGGLVNGEMVMEGERRLSDGSLTTERITWTPDANGGLRQLWQSSRDRGMRWTTVFNGVYRSQTPDVRPASQHSSQALTDTDIKAPVPANPPEPVSVLPPSR